MDNVVRVPTEAHLILDLGGVEFLASSGLALLVTARAGEDGIRGRLHLAGVIGNRAVERPMAAVALLDLFDITTDVDQLVVELSTVQPTD